MNIKYREIEYTFIGLLQNFFSSGKHLELDSDFTIEKLTEAELRKFLMGSEDISLLPERKRNLQYYAKHHFIKIIRTVKPTTIFAPFRMFGPFKDMVVYLNLLKQSSGSVLIPKVFFRKSGLIRMSRDVQEWEFCNMVVAGIGPNDDLIPSKDYSLELQEMPRVQRIIRKFKDILGNVKDETGYLRISCDFFMEGNLKERDIYREPLQIVDYVTALEALYILPNEKKLTQLLSQRASLLLGIDSPDARKKALEKFLKRLYCLRGQIVHGEIKKETVNSKIERHYPTVFYDEESRIYKGSLVKKGKPKYDVPEEVMGILGLSSSDYLTNVREIVRISILKVLCMQAEFGNKEKIVENIDKAVSGEQNSRNVISSASQGFIL